EHRKKDKIVLRASSGKLHKGASTEHKDFEQYIQIGTSYKCDCQYLNQGFVCNPASIVRLFLHARRSKSKDKNKRFRGLEVVFLIWPPGHDFLKRKRANSLILFRRSRGCRPVNQGRK